METKHRHLIEQRDNILEVVQHLEIQLGIASDGRWDPTSIEWVATAEKVRLRRYQRALDTLEGLVVVRIFELSKMNMSQIGKLTDYSSTIVVQYWFSC